MNIFNKMNKFLYSREPKGHVVTFFYSKAEVKLRRNKKNNPTFMFI